MKIASKQKLNSDVPDRGAGISVSDSMVERDRRLAKAEKNRLTCEVVGSLERIDALADDWQRLSGKDVWAFSNVWLESSLVSEFGE